MTIKPGSDLSSDLSCSDDPAVPALSSDLACGEDGMTITSALACIDYVDALTLSSDQAPCGPPVFLKDAPVAVRSSGRFFLI